MSDETKKTPHQQHEEFLAALAEFLMARVGAQILVLVEFNSRGVELFRNTNSLAWCEGALRVGDRTIRRLEAKLIASSVDVVDKIEQDEMDRIEAAVKRDKEKTN